MIGDGVCQMQCLTVKCENDHSDCDSQLCSSGCYPYMLGDGTCHPPCNTPSCNYDSPDCDCSPNCPPSLLSNSICDLQCNTTECEYDLGDCYGVVIDCNDGCTADMIGNGVCDERCYTEECEWDGVDCGCAPGCRYEEIGSCKVECLNVNCAYGDLNGYAPCEDSVKRQTQLYADIYRFSYFDTFPITPYDPETTCNPRYGETWESLFDHCSFFTYDFNTTKCLYNVGMCKPVTERCIRPVASSGCLECVDGLVNIAGECEEKCPQGTVVHSEVSGLCVPSNDRRTVTVYVDPEYGGEDSDGSWERPYPSLHSTLPLWSSLTLRILLIGPTHFFGSESQPTYLPNLYDWMDDALSYQHRNISISPFECESSPLCPHPTIYLSGSIFLMSPFKSGYYCSNAKKPWLIHFLNLDFTENPLNSLISEQYFLLRSGSFRLTNVTFFNFHYGVSIVNFIVNNDIILKNVNFIDVFVKKTVFALNLMSEFGDLNCGGFYYNSSFEVANFTYEIGEIAFSDTISTSFTFLSHIFLNKVVLSHLKITNLVTSNANFTLINANSCIYIEFNHCFFANNRFEAGYFLNVSSNLWSFENDYEIFTIKNGISSINLNVSNCEFRNNSFSAGGHFLLIFTTFMQNLWFENVTFSDENAVLIAIYGNILTKRMNIYGAAYLNPQTKRRVQFDPAVVTLTAVRIENCTCPRTGLMHFSQIPYVTLSVQITGSNLRPQPCFPAILSENSYSLTLSNSSISQFHCISGVPGLHLLSSIGPITLQNSVFRDLDTSSDIGNAVSITSYSDIFFQEIEVRSCKNAGIGTIFITGFSPLNLSIKSILLQENSVNQFGAGLFLSNITSISIEKSRFYANSAYSGGGVYVTSSMNFVTKLAIFECDFSGNAVGYEGGSVFIVFSMPSVLLQMSIWDSEFRGNKGYNGAVMYISESIQLQSPSYLSGVRISSSQSYSAALYFTYQNGTLALSDVQFKENIGVVESCLYVKLRYASGSYRSKIVVRGSGFEGNEGEYTVRIPYTTTGMDLELSEVWVEGGRGVGWHLGNVGVVGRNCRFVGISGTGMVLVQQAVGVLEGMVMQENAAVTYAPGVHLSSQSSLSCISCVFHHNSQTTSAGAIHCEGSSSLSISHSNFTHNHANSGSVLRFILSHSNTLTDCLFIDNSAETEGTVLVMSSSLSIRNCRFTNNSAATATGFVIIESNLALFDCILSHQSGSTGYFLFITSLSDVNLTNSYLFSGKSLQQGAIYVEESHLSITNSSVFDVIGQKGSLIYAFGSANVTIFDTFIENSEGKEGNLVYLWLSNGIFSHFKAKNYTGTAIFALESTVLVANSSFFTGKSENGAGIKCESCLKLRVSSCIFKNLTGNMGGAMEIIGKMTDFDEIYIEKSVFEGNNGGNGGGIYAQDVFLTLNSSIFTSNSAENGGGLMYSHSDTSGNVSLTVSDCEFAGNTGSVKGGGIAWEGSVISPVFNRVVYQGNEAMYGGDIASFPVAVDTESRDVSGSVSGQNYPGALSFSLIDHYGHIVSSDNLTKVGLVVTGPNATVYGTTELTVTRGQVTFQDFTIAADPGSNVTLKGVVAGLTSVSEVEVEIRVCEPGESQVGIKCMRCEAPKYSLNPEDPCVDCPMEAVCTGGAEVYPKEGYWRYDWRSNLFLECPNEKACVGYGDGNRTCGECAQGNDTCSPCSSLTGLCSPGYTGNMCQTCSPSYHRTSKIWCSSCPSYTTSLSLSVLYTLAVLIFCIAIVITSLKSARKPRSLYSVYLKLLMNYLQLVMLMGAFNLNWPTLTKEMLNIQDQAGSFSEHLFTFDCLTDNFDENDAFFTKLILLSCTPITFFLLSSLCWLFIAVIKRSGEVVKNELVGSAVVLFFLVHPSVMRVLFLAFNCEEVRPGEYWVVGLYIRCWEGKHLTYTLALALPGIIVWGLGLPGLILAFLIRSRASLQSLNVNIRFGYLIKGYQLNKFYWEFVVIYRKLLIISIATFLTRIEKMTQALMAMTVLMVTLILQHHHKPHNHPHLNTMEHRSILVSCTTLFFGLYYLDSTLNSSLKVFFFSITLTVNIYFLQFWLRKMMNSLFVIAIKRIGWLRSRFVVVDEGTAMTNKAFLSVVKSKFVDIKRRRLMENVKKLYFAKLEGQKME